MATMDRRSLLRLMAAAPMAAAFTWTHEEAVFAGNAVKAAQAQAGQTAFTPVFFTAHEYQTVTVLVDYIIPKDERSGSASEAGVPQFMDFMMTDQPNRQNAMRGGLAWLDLECHRRFDKRFIVCTDAERRQVLDDISWPRRTVEGMNPGVTFFNSFRDLTASGFWTSEMGINDIQYMGNTFVPKWTGCPPEVLTKLGLE